MTVSGSAFANEIALAIMPAGTDMFDTAEAKGFKQEAESLGARAIVGDSKSSVEVMANGSDDLIPQHVDAIAPSPVDDGVSRSLLDKLARPC